MTNSEYALCCKALGEQTRIEIFDMLKGGEMCACKILEKFNCTQPTLSYHMKTLIECGLVVCIKKGKWRHYSISNIVLSDLLDYLSNRVENAKECNCL